MQNHQDSNTNSNSPLNTINSLGDAICSVAQNTTHPHLGAISSNVSKTTIIADAPKVKLPSYYDELATKYNLMTHEEVNTLMALTAKVEKTKFITDRIKIIAYIIMILSCIGAILPLAIELSKRKIILTSTGRRRSFSRRHRGSSAIARNGRSDQY